MKSRATDPGICPPDIHSAGESHGRLIKLGLISRLVPENLRWSLELLRFGFFKIPLIFYVRPHVVELTPERIVVKIPLRRRTMNHLGSMYFGVLATGADCAAGLLAMKIIREKHPGITLIFRRFSAEFFRRAEGDVFFRCDDGQAISKLVATAAETGERVERDVSVVATVPALCAEESVARLVLTLSLKKKT